MDTIRVTGYLSIQPYETDPSGTKLGKVQAILQIEGQIYDFTNVIKEHCNKDTKINPLFVEKVLKPLCNKEFANSEALLDAIIKNIQAAEDSRI